MIEIDDKNKVINCTQGDIEKLTVKNCKGYTVNIHPTIVHYLESKGIKTIKDLKNYEVYSN